MGYIHTPKLTHVPFSTGQFQKERMSSKHNFPMLVLGGVNKNPTNHSRIHPLSAENVYIHPPAPPTKPTCLHHRETSSEWVQFPYHGLAKLLKWVGEKLPKFNSEFTTEKWWLEDFFPFGMQTFHGQTVKLRGEHVTFESISSGINDITIHQ